MPGHATRRQVIAGVLVPRGVRTGMNAGRRRQWPSPNCLHPKSDGPHFGLQGRVLPSPNLLATDAHDLECVLLRSPALEWVLAEYGSWDKTRRFEGTHDCKVGDALLARGLVFGRLRLFSKHCGWDLSLAKLGLERFTDQQVPRGWIRMDSTKLP